MKETRTATSGSSAEVAAGELECVVCDLCGADDAEPVIELRDLIFRTTSQQFKLVRCRACGLHYLNPRPRAERLGQYYHDDYAPFARAGLSARVKGWTLRREVDDLWPLLAPPARVVDVGCATGELLQVIRARGNPNVSGIEPNQHAASIAHDRFGLDVCRTLGEAGLAAESLDVALLAHTIEHLPSPSQTLKELARVLKPGGTLVLWLPNADSIASHLLRQYWIGYDAPRHLYDFTPRTLSLLLARNGFDPCSAKHEWIGIEWSWALRLWVREHVALRRLNQVLTTLHPELSVAFSPVSVAAALCRRGGRIRLLATKRI